MGNPAGRPSEYDPQRSGSHYTSWRSGSTCEIPDQAAASRRGNCWDNNERSQESEERTVSWRQAMNSDQLTANGLYHVGYYSALRPHEYIGGLPPTNRKIDTGKNSNSVASFADPSTYTPGYAIEAHSTD